LHPVVEKKLGVSGVFVFELKLESALSAKLPTFKSVSKFPSIRRDLSVVIRNDIPAAKLAEALRSDLGDALVKVELFDVYQGDGVAEGLISVSFSLVLQNKEKTMTDEEAEQLQGTALTILQEKFGAELRS